MKIRYNPHWLLCKNASQAHIAQKEMAEQIIIHDDFTKPLTSIGGMDVSNIPFDPQHMIFGAVVVCAYSSLHLIETATQALQQTFPYIPGLLGFREVPVLVQAYNQLSVVPDIIMVDGHGISHPRGLGVASHVGVLLDKPTIGVAKSILVGTPAASLGENVGSMVPLMYKGHKIAMIVRTKKRCLPLIISAGHKVSLETAIEVVMSCLKKYRLPEPTRYAHAASNSCRIDFQKTH